MKNHGLLKPISILVATIVAISILQTQSASATQTLTLIAEDSFDYTGNIVGKSGGSGFTNNWSDAYSGSNYSIATPGLTYPGLTTAGGYMYSCSATPNQVCGVSRQIPAQSSGVIYLQMIANFGSQNGGGTPNLRFNDAAGARVGGLGSNGGTYGTKISILDADLAPKSDGTSSAGTLNADTLIILRIDYTRTISTLYLNPDMSTFSYFNPPTADATWSGLAPSIKTIEFFSRSGVKYDEFKVYSVTGTSAADDQAALDADKKKREDERQAAIKVAREKINNALFANLPVTSKDLADADLPIKSVDSLLLAYKELLSVKYSLTKPLTSDEAYALKFNKFMKYAMYERMTGINSGSVFGRDLVKYGVISPEVPMKQLSTYQLMKQPLNARDSIAKVNDFFAQSAKSFADRKAHLAAMIERIQSR